MIYREVEERLSIATARLEWLQCLQETSADPYGAKGSVSRMSCPGLASESLTILA